MAGKQTARSRGYLLRLPNKTLSMKRILILATDQAITEVLRKSLSSSYDIMTVDDPDNILKNISGYKPDILLIDFFLNDINGGAICHQLKCNPHTHKIPVILLTEYPELILFSKKFGCNAAVSKPVDLAVLHVKIKELTAKVSDKLFSSGKSSGLNHKNRVFQH